VPGDAELRQRRRQRDLLRRAELDSEFVTAFAQAIRQHYPKCPAGTETLIAEHACLRHSGRVGRTAAAKALDVEAIRRAVIAHIRHCCTDFDELLARYGDRETARAEVWGRVEEVLREWEKRG
jgi:hypothetical protein